MMAQIVADRAVLQLGHDPRPPTSSWSPHLLPSACRSSASSRSRRP